MEQQPNSKTNDSTLWKSVFVGMLCVALGFLGGWLAIEAQGNSLVGSSTQSQEIVLQESEVIADVVEKVKPSVVSISVTAQNVTSDFFGNPQATQEASEGSGIILSADGLVVTNKHVIPENTQTVAVIMSDGTQYADVDVVGRDPFNDIAFLQIKNVDDLQAAKLGDSDAARVGDKVIAIGNALGEFDNTVTSGIVSGLGRPIVAGSGSDAESLQNLLQTDAAINPGNSGGPLMNINGEVIAINTAVAGNGAQNIGFAIPINDVKSGIASVEKNGELIRPYLGVRYVMLNPAIAKELEIKQESGALVSGSGNGAAVLKDSPADKAGIRENDIITKINDDDVNENNQLVTLVSRYQVGDTLKLTIIRENKEETVEVTLEAVPDSVR